MADTYWHRQTADRPLFPELLWSRPEQKSAAGKLLIIGGNLHGFAAPAGAYMLAQQAGAGTIRVLLPYAIKKAVGPLLDTAEFAPSTSSGSFSQKALYDLLDQASWADGVLIAGDLGRNSETAILLEKFLDKYEGAVTLTNDAADYAQTQPNILQRPDTLLVLTLSQLQKLAQAKNFGTAFTSNMDLLKLIDTLHLFTEQNQVSIITQHANQLVVGYLGHISTTPAQGDSPGLKAAAFASVWWLQNPQKQFEALTTAILNDNFTN